MYLCALIMAMSYFLMLLKTALSELSVSPARLPVVICFRTFLAEITDSSNIFSMNIISDSLFCNITRPHYLDISIWHSLIILNKPLHGKHGQKYHPVCNSCVILWNRQAYLMVIMRMICGLMFPIVQNHNYIGEGFNCSFFP